ncbi:MAG: diacylglycerol kinase family protein [Pseudomonadota bacterium]
MSQLRKKNQQSFPFVALDSLPPLVCGFRSPKVAVVLNGNARGVNNALISNIRRVLKNEDLFLSYDLAQAKFIARQIVNRAYDVVFCGGGDGTFMRCTTDIMELRPTKIPSFGILRLGTGNGLAETMGASKKGVAGLVADLRQVRVPTAFKPLPILRVEDQLMTFVGVGLDAMILEDYCAVKNSLGKTPLRAFSEGAFGYTLAIAGRSIRRCLFEPQPEVIVRNEGATTRRINLDGEPIGRPISKGEVIFHGPITVAAASTIPFYGLGLRLFPQANKCTDRFQLRVGNVSTPELLSQIPAIFRGEFQHKRVHDFLCTAISIHTPSRTPFQFGGDLAGQRRHVFINMTTVPGVVGPNHRSITNEVPVAHFSKQPQLAS